ncbi:hypothetical protein PMIN04_007973 [Paraphaeosphaeria minitans]
MHAGAPIAPGPSNLKLPRQRLRRLAVDWPVELALEERLRCGVAWETDQARPTVVYAAGVEADEVVRRAQCVEQLGTAVQDGVYSGITGSAGVVEDVFGGLRGRRKLDVGDCCVADMGIGVV